MDATDDSFNDLFDFDPFDYNGQDIGLVADRHLFDNGPDLLGITPPGLNDESLALPRSGYSDDQFAHGTLEGNIGLSTSDREFFDKSLDLFTNENFDTELTNLAPLDGPIPEFMAQQYNGLGLTFDSAPPNNSELPALTVQPDMVLGGIHSLHHVVLATTEEEQQWQAFKYQQTLLLHPEPHTSQFQPIRSAQQWEDVQNELGFVRQPPLQPPVNEPIPAGFQGFSELELPQDSQQSADFQQLDILSDDQIHLLQNVESEENVHPSVEVTLTDHSVSRDEANSEPFPRSRNNLTQHRSSSSRTLAPEQTSQNGPPPQTKLAGLTFASLKDAEAAMSSRYIENTWESPPHDTTVPNTQEKRAEYVREMFEAFQDTSKCKDNTNGHSFVKRWKTGGYYNLQSMEMVCWYMLDIAERLHESGPSSTVIYCEEALKKLKGSRLLTFEQRIHAICDMLKFSKYLCDQLMKGEGLEALVGAPKQKMSGATTMQVQNMRRQKWIVHGRTENPDHEENKNEGGEQNDVVDTQPASREKKPKAKRATLAKSRAIAKTRSTKISRYESSDDETSVHRRQSSTGISRTEDEGVTEMADEPQQVIVREPSPLLRIAHPTPLVHTSSRHRLPELSPVPSAVVSPLAAPASPLSLTSLTRSPSAFPLVSPKTTPNHTPRKRVASPHVRVSRAEVYRGRARFEKQREHEKSGKERDARVHTNRTTTKTQRETSSTKHVATKSNTKTGSSKRPIDLFGTDLEDEESAHSPKRQRKEKGPFAKRLALLGGSHTRAELDKNDDVSEDEENNDESDGVGEDESGMSGIASPSPPPSPTRKRKMKNAATKGRIQMVHPLIMTANRATKPKPKLNKRKAQKESDSEENSDSKEDGAPLAKRTKRSVRSTRKPAIPVKPAAKRGTLRRLPFPS